MLEEHCHESLEGSERRTVNHHRTMLLVVISDILELETLREVVVYLDCTKLPLSSDGILHHEVELRSIERSLTILNYSVESLLGSSLDDS